MNNLLYHSIESAICIAAFYAFYFWFLRKDTFFKANRFFLLFAVLFSLILPLLSFKFPLDSLSGAGTNSSPFSISIKSGISQIGAVVIYNTQENSGFSLIQIISGIYLLGVTTSFGLFVSKLISLFQTIRQADKQTVGEYCFVKTGEQYSQIYSFFNFIFIHRDKLNRDDFAPAIEHEKIHARQLHSLDLIVIELIIVLQWYNPFIYLLRKMVVENHEFQTDRSVLQTPVKKENYLRMILDQVVNSHYIRMTSAFSYTLSKKRLTMLTKMKPSTNKAKIKFLALLPVLASMFIFFSYPDSPGKTVQTEQKQKEEQKATTTDTIRDKEDVFIRVEKMPVYKKGQGIEGFRRDMQMKLKYPEKAAEKGISGTVYLGFIVNKNGEPVNPEILRKAHPLLNEAALKAFEKMPDWKEAGKQRGQKVNVQFNIPVVFKLDEEDSDS